LPPNLQTLPFLPPASLLGPPLLLSPSSLCHYWEAPALLTTFWRPSNSFSCPCTPVPCAVENPPMPPGLWERVGKREESYVSILPQWNLQRMSAGNNTSLQPLVSWPSLIPESHVLWVTWLWWLAWESKPFLQSWRKSVLNSKTDFSNTLLEQQQFSNCQFPIEPWGSGNGDGKLSFPWLKGMNSRKQDCWWMTQDRVRQRNSRISWETKSHHGYLPEPPELFRVAAHLLKKPLPLCSLTL
jgi:hypothetical protein